jgi:hypothetical protein
MNAVIVGQTLHQAGRRIVNVFFANGGVYSVVNEMRNGALVEVATVGCEGMLGVGVFLGDGCGAGRTLLQVPDGPLPSMTATDFVKESSTGAFRHNRGAVCTGERAPGNAVGCV